MGSPVTAADFDAANFSGDECDQLRQMLSWGGKLKLLLAFMFKDNGSITDEFLQLFTSKLIPVGYVGFMPVNATPEGYFVLNGQEVSKTTYANLYSVIGDVGGVAVGPGNFKLPDFQGKYAMGASGIYPIASMGGEASHVLTIPELPSHTHQSQNWDVLFGGAQWEPEAAGDNSGNLQPGAVTTATGSDTAHNNLPPYWAGLWLIKF